MASSILYELETLAGDEAANEPLDDAQRRVALQAFLVAHYERLRHRLVRHLGCASLASECLHDAWLRLGEMEVRAAVQNPEAYVYRVACNVAMDRMRSQRPWQYVGDADDALADFADQTPGPAQTAAARADLRAVDRALARLPRRHRAVLVALRIDEMSRHEVASRQGISLRSVDTALRQALDYCAVDSGREAWAGVRGTRRALRGREPAQPPCAP
jgi:RNA polymerase sigma factor (sigma-70 family)